MPRMRANLRLPRYHRSSQAQVACQQVSAALAVHRGVRLVCLSAGYLSDRWGLPYLWRTWGSRCHRHPIRWLEHPDAHKIEP